jgi:hypothetical protein
VIDNLTSNQDDKAINDLIIKIKGDTNFPQTENVRTIAEYLYKELDQNQTMAFQKLLMFWNFSGQGASSGPDLDAMNHIIDLQTNDKDYKYADQIPAHINNRN